MKAGRWLLPIALAAAPVRAADTASAPVALGARETFDLWDVADGGVRRGGVLLNKLQVSGTVRGDSFGLPGLSAHGQIFRTDGRSLSARTGDIQTVSNIEAPTSLRLFEAWLEQRIGNDATSLSVRAGLMDLNSQFDSVDPASLFINSSHGIAPDLSRSGRNGPSIFPVSSAGASVSLFLGKAWTFRVAAFDGVPGDPARPHAFVAARLARSDGALLIAQADCHPGDDATIEAGAWHYTARTLAGAGERPHDQGLYASVAAPLPGLAGWSGWVRVGLADQDAQPAKAYLGGGVVRRGLFDGRPDDRLGIAVAHAIISGPARAAYRLPRAETTIEASYQIEIHRTVALQPDLQLVRHPAVNAGVATALVLGTRLVLTLGYPSQPSATDAADPTVPPEGPQPADANGRRQPVSP